MMRYLKYQVIDNNIFKYLYEDDFGNRHVEEIPVRINGEVNGKAVMIANLVKKEVEKEKNKVEPVVYQPVVEPKVEQKIEEPKAEPKVEQKIEEPKVEPKVEEPKKNKIKVKQYKNGTSKMRNKSKRFFNAAILALAIAAFGSSMKTEVKDTKPATTIEAPQYVENDIVIDGYDNYTGARITEDELINASTTFVEECDEIGLKISNGEAFYFVTLLNIEPIKYSNPDLLNIILSQNEYTAIKNSSDYVLGQLASASINTGSNINLSAFMFDHNDAAIYDSVKFAEEQLKDAVRNNEYEEIQSIVGFNYYQPLLLNNRHFLQASGEEIKHKPSAGVRYVLEDYDSLLIRDIAKGNLDTMFDNELLSFQGNPATEHELENIVKTKTTAY